MIIIRTDANKTIATGHLMRTLSIAKECIHLGVQVCYVFADNESAELMKKLCLSWQDYYIKVLNSQFNDMDAELDDFIDLLKMEKPTAILVDSYFVTEIYLAEIKKYAKLFYLDDLKAFDYPVDAIINYTENPRLAPVREQFRDIPYMVREKVQDILITTGGTDEGNLTGEIINAINFMTDPVGQSINCHVLIGIMNRHRDKLQKMTTENPHIIIYENHSEMADLMRKCDLAISAAGSTLYELCAVGVPTICFVTADNQIPNATTLSAQGALIYAEDKNFSFYINEMVSDYSKRKKMSAKMRSLVDGYGAFRIAEMLANAEILTNAEILAKT